MAKALRKSKKNLLGYSEEAIKVDNLTMALRHRAGVHHYNNVEVASVARKWASIVQQLGTGRTTSRTGRGRPRPRTFPQSINPMGHPRPHPLNNP